jgi:hypothetical protein
MNYAEIIIDGQYSIELSGANISIPTTYELIDITNLNRRSGSKTKTISIPRTKTNDKIFGIPYNLSANNQFDKFSSRQITIKKNSFVIFDGLFKLTDITIDTINLYAFAELSKLKELFGESTLNELNLTDLDHLYDETIFDTWNGIYPVANEDYFYPLIDYGQFDGKIPAANCEAPNQDIKITDLRPAVYLQRIIKQMIVDSGYTLQTTFFDNPILQKLMIPFTNNEFIHSVEGGISVNGFWGYNEDETNVPAGTDGVFIIPVDTEIYDPLNQWDISNNEYIAATNQTTKWSASFYVRFDNPTASFNAGEEGFFIVERYDGASWTQILNSQIVRPGQKSLFNFTYSGTQTFAAGEGLRFKFNKQQETINVSFKMSALTFDTSAGGKTIDVGEFVQLAPNLPPIKQSDLFKYCYQMFNWVVLVNDVTGVVSIETYETYYRNGGQKNFSGKVSLKPNPVISYQQTNFARKYDFKYKGDDKDYWLLQYNLRQTKGAQYPFGDGNYYLTQDGEAKTIGVVGFSPTIIEKTFTGTAPSYIYLPTMWQDTRPVEWTTDRMPRILINAGLIDISKLSDVYTELSTEGATCIVNQVPLCYFQKTLFNDNTIDAYDLNLSFSTPIGIGFTTKNLIDTYYKPTIDQLNISASLVAYFNLTARDIAELDFSQLWYVEYFNSIFRLNKIIDFEPNGKGLTKVELINVGVAYDYGDEFISINPTEYIYLNTEILEDIITENNNDIII